MEGLDVVREELMVAARAASERAYAPYSEFRVGAAVLTESGEVLTGCNVENASYSLTICAERNAIFQAVGAGHRRITGIVVYVPSGDPAPPCGACRQVMAEFASGAEVLCFSGNGASLRTTVDELLPYPFRLES
jgi:cytidine deaminase